MPSRRQFLKMAAATGTGLTLSRTFWPHRAWAFAQSPTNIRKFITTLPGLGPAGANNIGQYLPLANKATTTFAGRATDVYKVGVRQFAQRMHPDLPAATHFWGYYDLGTGDQKYLGGVIVAKRGTPILLNVTNQLPNKAIIPIDPTVSAGANQVVGDLPLNRIATHLHGGFTPWFSDGTPFQWFDPTGRTGPSFMNVPGTNPAAGTATYYYPMDQSARLVWYHDHAMGITRTNAYSGIASALVIVDDFEIGLVNSGLLPDLVGIPLVVQDKSFVGRDILTQDPTWQWGQPGDLWYPHIYEPTSIGGNGPNPTCAENPKGRWDYGPCQGAGLPGPSYYALPPVSIVPEGFMDTILVNGGVYPTCSVPPRRVRFRILNGSQARFYHLNLYAESSSNSGEANLNAPGPVMYQVGTEGGFLPAVSIHRNGIACPLVLDEDPTGNTANPDGPFNLLLAPAERADVVIDFNGVPAASSFILYSDAPAPFPGGDARNDYFTGQADLTAIGGAPSTLPGFGPNTRTLMKITVTSGVGDSVSTPAWLSSLNVQLRTNFLTGNQPGLLYNNGDPSKPGPVPYKGRVDRRLTLNEDYDDYGRLIQTMGTFTSRSLDNANAPTWGLPYMMDATETPSAGATEVWQIFNLTGDTHPIHFHLVNVQVIQRQPFEGTPDKLKFTGPPVAPDANELGWKETVRMNPGEATTVIAQFTLPRLPAAMGDPKSPRTGGHEYVWHCHILEHEEHDMMRPLVVK
ncbi:MAG TPA: multicopper oxidase domain-containing protein [Acidobacteriaceae bacterium]|nr:multicopper oxidase domain-containing protein [Acidobacteriaceae bacterium]